MLMAYIPTDKTYQKIYNCYHEVEIGKQIKRDDTHTNYNNDDQMMIVIIIKLISIAFEPSIQKQHNTNRKHLLLIFFRKLIVCQHYFYILYQAFLKSFVRKSAELFKEFCPFA